MILDPARLVPMRRIVVGPMDHATALVPDVLPSQRHRISRLYGNARCEIPIMRDQNRETVSYADQKPLMSCALGVLRQKPDNSAGSFDLDTGRMRPGGGAQRGVDGARIGGKCRRRGDGGRRRWLVPQLQACQGQNNQ
jgi:hypothetical protein